MLRGRQRESGVVDGLLDGARVARSGVLVVRGEVGIGKTALIEYAIELASDFTVVRAAGVESEMELPFAGLHQLCAPMLDRLDELPAPQRAALAVAFGLRTGDVPDRFLVGLAALGLVSEMAEDRPLLCVIDDAQWLDRISAQTMAFVARRVLAESVVLLFAVRGEEESFQGLPELVLEGLRPSDARELLRSVIPGRLDERVADQLVADTRGNPLALLELPRGLSAAQLAGGFGLPGALSLEGRIQERFLRRFNDLPDDLKQLLLVAAAEPTGDPALVRAAAGELGIGELCGPAESGGLLDTATTVSFRHPLARSAVYQTASVQERRVVHRALADVTDAQVDPDRRAWHLAAATPAPDEDVAAELERAAGRAQARGGVAAAAAFLERAAGLTIEPSRRTHRALAAGQAKLEAGLLNDALNMSAIASAAAAGGHERAKVDLLGARIAFAARRGRDAPPLLLKAARDLEAFDVTLARATYLEALSAAMFAGRLAGDAGVREVSEAVLASATPTDPTRAPDLLLQGLAIRFTDGFVAAAPILKQALVAFRRETGPDPGEDRWLSLACWTAAALWDEDTGAVLASRHLERARKAGALTAIPAALSVRSTIVAMSGDLAAAASMVDEMREVAEAVGMATPPYGSLLVASLRGREAELERLIETAVGEAVARGEGLALGTTAFVRATLYNGLGRYEAALAALRDTDRSDVVGRPTLAESELIEAAARSGHPQVAARALEELAELTRASGTAFAAGVEARSRALVSDGKVAEGHYRESIERLASTGMRVQLARAHLVYGEWLRRERRRVHAREQLRTAEEMFTEMGVEAFAGRAARELLATGERVRKRTVESQEELTSQEVQVARLAREGLSNPEIGARLFISRHTVEYHLRKVFTKLGINSRHQLDRALPAEAAART